jgi:hypothetical protein
VQKEFDKLIANKDEEISHLRNHSQNLITHIKKLKGEKKSQQETLKKLTSKESLIDKKTMTDLDEKTMTDLVEIKKSLGVKNQNVEKRIDTIPNKILSTNISLEVSKDEISKNKM